MCRSYVYVAWLQRQHLLRLGVPAMFMQIALDEAGPPIKYQCAELGKLYSVVSYLIRCCDVSARCQSSQQVQATFVFFTDRKHILQYNVLVHVVVVECSI